MNTAPVTSSRTPRDTRLQLVPRRPVAAARRTVTARRASPAPPPPEGVPSRDQLARQARAALADAVRLARWIENGGSPPETTRVAEACAAELRMTVPQVRGHWDRARLAGLIELHDGTARAGWRLRAWDRDDGAVLRGWVGLFDAWSLAFPAPTPADPSIVAEVIEAAPQLLSVMHLSAGPVTFWLLDDLLTQRISELRAERSERTERSERSEREPGDSSVARPSALHVSPVPASGPSTEPAGREPEPEPVPAAPEPKPAAPEQQTQAGHQQARAKGQGQAGGPHDVALSGLLDWALDGLAAVGALTRCPDEETGVRQGSAVLTPLGNWAVWIKLEQICVAAQSPAGNIEQSAEDMLRGCARLTPGPARDEYRAWLAARSTSLAISELLDAARGEDALIRGLAFEALRVVGSPAEDEVRAVAAEPALRPYALLWLAELEGADPEDLAGGAPGVLTREEATWLWVDTAAAVTDHGEERLLVDHLETAVQGSVPSLLREVRATGHPRTVQVLVALAAAHPDPALAKAVRRAAFQVHTGGA